MKILTFDFNNQFFSISQLLYKHAIIANFSRELPIYHVGIIIIMAQCKNKVNFKHKFLGNEYLCSFLSGFEFSQNINKIFFRCCMKPKAADINREIFFVDTCILNKKKNYRKEAKKKM